METRELNNLIEDGFEGEKVRTKKRRRNVNDTGNRRGEMSKRSGRWNHDEVTVHKQRKRYFQLISRRNN